MSMLLAIMAAQNSRFPASKASHLGWRVVAGMTIFWVLLFLSLAFALLLFASPVRAQTARNAITVSRLPPCNLARQGYPINVNDADPDCQTGSGVAGSKYVICQCDPTLGWITYYPGGGGGGAGLTGDLGAEARVIARTVGTGGDELEASPNLKQDASGNLIIEDLSGARSLMFSSVGTAPLCKRVGTALNCVGNTGDYIEFQVGHVASQDPAVPSTFAGGALVSNGKRLCFSNGADFSGCIERVSGTLTITDGTGGGVASAMNLRAGALHLPPLSAPPYTCDAGAKGSIYTDDEDAALCFCNGSAWAPVFGLGSCS